AGIGSQPIIGCIDVVRASRRAQGRSSEPVKKSGAGLGRRKALVVFPAKPGSISPPLQAYQAIAKRYALMKRPCRGAMDPGLRRGSVSINRKGMLSQALSMRGVLYGINKIPHPEEAAKRLSRRACPREGGGRTALIHHLTPKTFITSSPRWLMTLT